MAMSGVSVADECVTALNDLRHKKSRYIIMHIVDQRSIAVKTIGQRNANFEEFIGAIDKSIPCYAAFDFEYNTPDGPRAKLILISWNPDSGAPRTKMLYSSSRDALAPLTQGFQGIQANDASGLDFEEIERKVKSNR
uniref:Putative cofilin/actin depolymerizing factor n=1 Tax=Trypanosoma congolense (strain IL3000) TaxID=1068625 RepID=G0UKH7_TRYCI|nr:putative cofilin/actin depolymerizing factor [Trypanosoma congolense IL3000]